MYGLLVFKLLRASLLARCELDYELDDELLLVDDELLSEDDASDEDESDEDDELDEESPGFAGGSPLGFPLGAEPLGGSPLGLPDGFEECESDEVCDIAADVDESEAELVSVHPENMSTPHIAKAAMSMLADMPTNCLPLRMRSCLNISVTSSRA